MTRRTRIWPLSYRTVGAMVDAGVLVRVGCRSCATVFDVDLKAIERSSGRFATLINASPMCRVTSCRGRAFFLAAASLNAPLLSLLDNDADPLGLNGRPASSLEPGGGAPPPVMTAQKRA